MPGLTAIGCYVYAGGVMTGVELAGFDVLCHLEGDGGYGVSSAQLNFPDRPMHYGPAKWPIDELASANVDFVMSQPPCAIFSPLGIVTTQGAESWKADPRLAHWFDSLRVLERVKPRAWCLESVPQAYTRGRMVIDEMTKRALVQGYSVTHLLLDAKWTGIPQSRKRFFIVAHRPARLIGYTWNWSPPPTVGEILETVSEPGVGIEVNPRYVEALKHTPPGTGLADAWMKLNPDHEQHRNAQGKVKGRPSFQDQRLDANSQMGAFVGHKFYHPIEDRAIGLNEAMALCGYPPDFKLAGPVTGLQSLLARAVMPPVGAWLARAVVTTLGQADAAWADRTVTLIDVRKPGIPEVDLTHQYLDASGRVRLRARTDGTFAWSWPNGSSDAPPVRSERVKVLTGISARPASSARLSVTEPNDEANRDNVLRVASRWQDRGDGEAAVDVRPPQPASGDRDGEAERRDPIGKAGGSRAAEVASRPVIRMTPEGPTPPEVLRMTPKPEVGEGSGKYMQRLWRTTNLSPEEILEAVHASYAGRTTARGDVYYNYKKMVDAGEAVRPWPGPTRRAKGVTVESARTPNPSSRGAACDPGPTEPSSATLATVEPALAAPATGLAARSTVVPERRGVVDRAMLYFSKLFQPEETASPLSSARMAWFLQDEIGFDAVYHQGAYSTEVVPEKIGELWVCNSSWMWNSDEWRRIIMRLFRVADRIVFCQNDYALILNSYHLGVIRDEANYVVLSTSPETTYMEKHGLRPTLVNWNVLTYAPRPETDVERQPGIYYYGSFRAGRQKVFDRYFKDPPTRLIVSASSGQDVKRYQQAYPSLNVVGRADDVYRELESWASTIVLEDDRANRTYVSPPNRFYEALSARCPMIFDAYSIPMFKRYGFDVEPCAVNGPKDLAEHLEATDWVDYVGDLQHEWHRDFIGELREQLAEARRALDRGELGRMGAPAHLKRYVLTEDGGEY